MVRRCLLVALIAPICAVAVCACGGSGVSACRTAQLNIRLGHTGAAMGSVGSSAVFTDSSSSPCTLRGYPSLQMLDASGAHIPTRVTRTATTVPRLPARLVSLRPGGHATFYIGFADATGFAAATCPTSSRVEITPPGDLSPITVTWQLQPYGGSTEYLQCGRIAVSPVISGAHTEP
jgi:hypothetical protein